MTAQVITVTPATTLAEFARICTEDDISGAPVMQIGGDVVGMVTKTDLIERLIRALSGNDGTLFTLPCDHH